MRERLFNMCKAIEDMMKKAEKEGEQKAELRIK